MKLKFVIFLIFVVFCNFTFASDFTDRFEKELKHYYESTEIEQFGAINTITDLIFSASMQDYKFANALIQKNRDLYPDLTTALQLYLQNVWQERNEKKYTRLVLQGADAKARGAEVGEEIGLVSAFIATVPKARGAVAGLKYLVMTGAPAAGAAFGGQAGTGTEAEIIKKCEEIGIYPPPVVFSDVAPTLDYYAQEIGQRGLEEKEALVWNGCAIGIATTAVNVASKANKAARCTRFTPLTFGLGLAADYAIEGIAKSVIHGARESDLKEEFLGAVRNFRTATNQSPQSDQTILQATRQMIDAALRLSVFYRLPLFELKFDQGEEIEKKSFREQGEYFYEYSQVLLSYERVIERPELSNHVDLALLDEGFIAANKRYKKELAEQVAAGFSETQDTRDDIKERERNRLVEFDVYIKEVEKLDGKKFTDKEVNDLFAKYLKMKLRQQQNYLVKQLEAGNVPRNPNYILSQTVALIRSAKLSYLEVPLTWGILNTLKADTLYDYHALKVFWLNQIQPSQDDSVYQEMLPKLLPTAPGGPEFYVSGSIGRPYSNMGGGIPAAEVTHRE